MPIAERFLSQAVAGSKDAGVTHLNRWEHYQELMRIPRQSDQPISKAALFLRLSRRAELHFAHFSLVFRSFEKNFPANVAAISQERSRDEIAFCLANFPRAGRKAGCLTLLTSRMDEKHSQLWQKLSAALKPQVSPDTFKRWFSAVKLVNATDESLTFRVPNNIYQFGSKVITWRIAKRDRHRFWSPRA